MGGRGASSGMSEKGKPYGSEFRTLLKAGNVKFVKQNQICQLNLNFSRF